MRNIKIVFITIFVIVILAPVIFFNFTPNTISEIDNRMLAENPFLQEGDLTQNIENYVNDRIGFRDEMILAYTVLNDFLFDKMEHPSYTYGEEGYVFGAGLTIYEEYNQYHITFVDMIEKIQKYCEERDVPFLFVFNPAKPAIYEDKIDKGVNYSREWVHSFVNELEKRGINYLDNTETMKELRMNGIDGFNKKYDANHWNDIGAFGGTKKIQERIQEQLSTVHVNELSEFTESKQHVDSLLVSNFPIDEDIPVLSNTSKCINIAGEYSDLKLHPSYNAFGYYVNERRKQEEAPRALVFQGSYMNGYGYKFMMNSFGEYIHIHDYQNVIDLPYYFNIFTPDCVIFEVAEYTLYDNYFSLDKMQAIDYNCNIQSLSEEEYIQMDIAIEDITIEQGDSLTHIVWNTLDYFRYVWIETNDIYDMKKCEKGYEVTIKKEDIEKIHIYVSNF